MVIRKTWGLDSLVPATLVLSDVLGVARVRATPSFAGARVTSVSLLEPVLATALSVAVWRHIVSEPAWALGLMWHAGVWRLNAKLRGVGPEMTWPAEAFLAAARKRVVAWVMMSHVAALQ